MSKGFTFAGRGAFKTSGRFGLVPDFNNTIIKSKNCDYDAAVPLPVRFDNDKPASLLHHITLLNIKKLQETYVILVAAEIGLILNTFLKIMKQPKFFFTAIIFICFLCNGCNAQPQNNSLKLVTTIPLPNVSGRIDHLSFDSKHQLIFVAALGNNTVEVVDLKNKKVIRTIKDFHEPQGILFMPENNSIFVANGGNGECDVFNAETFQKITTIKLPDDADNVRYDAAGKKIYVGYGNGSIAIIDATTFKVITEIKLQGHPESFQIDKSSKRIYVNVPDGEQIEVIDLKTNSVADKWKIAKAKANFPMALDAANHRLFIGCRHPAKLLIIDTQTGKTISSFSIDNDVDDIFYNSVRKEIYLICGVGYINVFMQTEANTYAANGKVSTHPGARTSLFVPELNQLIVASPSGFNSNASLLIYEIKYRLVGLRQYLKEKNNAFQ